MTSSYIIDEESKLRDGPDTHDVTLPCIGVARGALLRKVAEEMIALMARPFPKSRAKRLAKEYVHSGGTSRNLLVRLISKKISKKRF